MEASQRGPSSESRRRAQPLVAEERTLRLRRLHDAVAVCPTDVRVRCELATLLEELGQPEEALGHWKAVLARDPNHLKAWEGVARCREELASGLPHQCRTKG